MSSVRPDCCADCRYFNGRPCDIEAALQRYERERIAFGRALIAHARHLGAYLEAPASPTKHRDPEEVLREYGAPHLVHDVDAG